MRMILSKNQFAAFVPKVIEICTRSQVARKSLVSPFCGGDLRPALDHLNETLKYNLVGGKMTR